MNTSPGTAGQAVVNEIASWTEAELDARITASLAKAEREAIVTEAPKRRCQFGRPHVWMHGFYEGDVFVTDMVKCATCGQIEED